MSSMYPPFGGNMPSPQCQRCGMPLPPREAYCRNCGEYNAFAQTNSFTAQAQPSSDTNWGRPTPQAPYGGSSSGGQQWGQTVAASAPLNAPYGGAAPIQQLPFPNDYYSPPNQTPAPTNYYTSSPQAAYAPPAMMNGFQPGQQMSGFPMGYAQPHEQKAGPRVGLIVGSILLLLLLIGGGIGGYALVKSQNHTASAIPTAIPTIAPSPTPSAKPLFKDTFISNTNGWYLAGSSDGKVSVKLGGGSLLLEDDENTLFPEFVPNRTFADFQLNVDATLSKGDQSNGYGVYIRVTSTQNDELGTYYRLELYGDSTFAIFKGTVDASGNSSPNQVVNFTSNSAIQKQGDVNHITIIAKGSSIAFTVNGATLHTLTDTSYRSGSVALFVSNVKNTSGGAQAKFSNLVIYPTTK